MADQAPTREELLVLCERGFVPEDEWHDRDSARAQRQLGEAYALLRSGCAFEVAATPESTADTWWIEFTFKGFDYFEGTLDGLGDLETDTRYIPTAARLDRTAGRDWY